MAHLAPPQGASQFAGRRNMAVAAAAMAAVLVLAAVVVHVRAGHRALLQSSAGLERHMQVVKSFSSLTAPLTNVLRSQYEQKESSRP